MHSNAWVHRVEEFCAEAILQELSLMDVSIVMA